MKLSDHGLAIIIIGLILTISVFLFFIGIPLIIIGAYFLNKKANQGENEINEKLRDKKEELANIDIKLKEMEEEKAKEIDVKLKEMEEEKAKEIDVKLREMEEEKAKEIDVKLKEKETELANIDVKLEEKEKEKDKEINEKLRDKKEELANIDIKLKEMEEEKVKEIDVKLKEEETELANMDVKLEEKEKEKDKEINEKLRDKKEELANIDIKLKEMEEEKVKEIDVKLKEKETELANMDVKLEEKEKEKDKEINEKLRDKKEELANIDIKLKEMEKEKVKEIDIKLEERRKKIDIRLQEKRIQLSNLNYELNNKKKGLILVDDALEMQEVGLYEPKYDFLTAVLYKEKWNEIRKKQKDLIKNKRAAVCETEWRLNDSIQQGRALTNAQIKQILRNFNLDCDMVISKVKISNRENSVKRIRKSFETLNKLNERNDIKITPQYLDLKLQELDVAIEYALKREEEKELLREAREREREERKIQRQLDAEEKKINEQKKRLETDITKIGAELRERASDEEKEKLKLRIRELELALAKSNDDIEQINNRRKRTGAGYVYILSNIGSFGENVYKIGVTRRDEPQDRVRELSNASVPFRFDTHVFIFSKEAFELERELHNRFDHKRVNKVNSRKEFFNITYDDVKKIVEENKELVHSFSDKPEAQEYYDTLKIEKMSNK